MAQWNVECFVGFPREADAHNVATGCVNAGGFCIQAAAFRLTDFMNRGIKIGHRSGAAVLASWRAFPSADGGEFFGEHLETQALKGFPGLGLIHAFIRKVMHRHRQFQIRHHGDQAAGKLDPRQSFLDARALPGLQLILVGQHFIQRAVSRQQCLRTLLADARHALHVVRCISHQSQHVHHLLGENAEALLHGGTVYPHLTVTIVEYLDFAHVIHELQQILVGADDDRRKALLCGLPSKGAHHVICLVSMQLHDGDVEGLDEFANELDLGFQVLRHLGPVGLVVRVDLVPKRRLRRIKHRREMRGLMLVHHGQKHPRHGVCRTILHAHVGIVRPKDERKGVDQI